MHMYIKNRNLFVGRCRLDWTQTRECFLFVNGHDVLLHSQPVGHFAYSNRKPFIALLTIYLIFYSNSQVDLTHNQQQQKQNRGEKNDKINETKIQKYTCRTTQCR